MINSQNQKSFMQGSLKYKNCDIKSSGKTLVSYRYIETSEIVSDYVLPVSSSCSRDTREGEGKEGLTNPQ